MGYAYHTTAKFCSGQYLKSSEYSIIGCLMHGNAFILRIATSGDDPVTDSDSRGFSPVGLILHDIGMRHHTDS